MRIFESKENYEIVKEYINGKRWNNSNWKQMNKFIKELFIINFWNWRNTTAFIYSKQYRDYVNSEYTFNIHDLFNTYTRFFFTSYYKGAIML